MTEEIPKVSNFESDFELARQVDEAFTEAGFDATTAKTLAEQGEEMSEETMEALRGLGVDEAKLMVDRLGQAVDTAVGEPSVYPDDSEQQQQRLRNGAPAHLQNFIERGDLDSEGHLNAQGRERLRDERRPEELSYMGNRLFEDFQERRARERGDVGPDGHLTPGARERLGDYADMIDEIYHESFLQQRSLELRSAEVDNIFSPEDEAATRLMVKGGTLVDMLREARKRGDVGPDGHLTNAAKEHLGSNADIVDSVLYAQFLRQDVTLDTSSEEGDVV